MALTYHRARLPKVTPTHPLLHTHTLNTHSYVQELYMHLNEHEFTVLIGPSSTEHEQDSCSFQLCCTVIYQTVPSSTRADTVVANATTKKVNEQDTETFPKCYVGRNSKRKQQKLRIQVCGSLKTQWNQGCHD